MEHHSTSASKENLEFDLTFQVSIKFKACYWAIGFIQYCILQSMACMESCDTLLQNWFEILCVMDGTHSACLLSDCTQ